MALNLLFATSVNASFDSRVDKVMTGGAVSTKSKSVWELWQYKHTRLLRKAPCKWCPFLAYLTVDKYVTVEGHDNKYYLCINTNLKKELGADARFNKRFAKLFPTHGTTKQQVRQIWRYCKRTTYVPHVKTARQVFTTRTGDCAGISAAFYVLCKAKKIPVRYVIGWSGGSCHAWNRVKISGTWYWIDATQGKWIRQKQYKNRSVMEMW